MGTLPSMDSSTLFCTESILPCHTLSLVLCSQWGHKCLEFMSLSVLSIFYVFCTMQCASRYMKNSCWIHKFLLFSPFPGTKLSISDMTGTLRIKAPCFSLTSIFKHSLELIMESIETRLRTRTLLKMEGIFRLVWLCNGALHMIFCVTWLIPSNDCNTY